MKSFEEYNPIEIANEVTLGHLIESIADKFPALLGCLAPDRLSVDELRALFTRLDGESDMFEGGHRGGRGDGYRAGQLTAGVRKVAVGAINKIIGDERRVVIDALGGNGTLARTSLQLL